MIFIFLLKWKFTMKKDVLNNFTKMYQELEKKGVKLQQYWTLGHYNFVTIMEAPSEKEAMKLLIPFVDVGDVEVLTAIPREEALKLV
ncbi:MAG: GYD domain-containing protein [Candidatus Bathyarchaeia archaeon]